MSDLATNSLRDVVAALSDLPSVPDPVNVERLLKMDLPEREMLLSPWLPEKALAMIAGPRGLGKTFLALNIAYAVASGGTFLGWKASRSRRVLCIDGEMPAATLRDRLAAITRNAPDFKNRFFLLAADLCEFGLPDLSTPEGQSALRPKLEPFDLILLDNLSTLCRSGRENEAESWAAFQAFLLELRRAGKSVVFIHHTGKGGGQRGTSKREDVLDSVLLMKRPPDYEPSQGVRFIVQFDKARGFSGEEAQSFEASFDHGAGGWARTAETRDAKILELSEAGLSIRTIESQTGIPKSTVDRILKRGRSRRSAQ